MGRSVWTISRKTMIAATLGIALIGAAVPAIEYLISQSADRQAQHEASALARRSLALAESQVGQIVATLTKLSEAKAASCRPADIEAMRRAVFASAPIKEMLVVSAAGEIVCANIDLELGARRVLASQALSGTPGMMLDIIILEQGMRMLCIRQAGGGLAAMAPVDVLLPRFAADGGPFAAFAVLQTASGLVIASSGAATDGAAGRGFMANAVSEKYDLRVEVELPKTRAHGTQHETRLIALLVAAIAAVLFVTVTIFRPRRDTDNPVSQLERALEAGEIIPYYQPIVDILTGQLRGAEVLARWRKPDGTLVQPASFIPLAESSGLIRPMTLALMKQVCAEAGPAIGRRPGMKITFNFSAQLFADDSIVTAVRQIVSKSPLKYQQIVLELTERDPIENMMETRRIVTALQGLGCRIAIDDVGTGHSGLSYILKLDADIIKIDKIFVDAIGTDRNSATIVETLVDLARNMRMDIIAEGVESFDQVMHLRDRGIRWAQGFVFAPPLPGGSFLQLVEAADPVASAAEPAAGQAVAAIALAGHG